MAALDQTGDQHQAAELRQPQQRPHRPGPGRRGRHGGGRIAGRGSNSAAPAARPKSPAFSQSTIIGDPAAATASPAAVLAAMKAAAPAPRTTP